MLSKVRSAVGERSQKMRSARNLQVIQLSTISRPYGESMNQPPLANFSNNFTPSPDCPLWTQLTGRWNESGLMPVSGCEERLAVLCDTCNCDVPHRLNVTLPVPG